MSNRRHAPSLDQLLQQAALHKLRRELPPISRIDRGLPFICETLAPLFYTPIYQDFTPNQRLRYNQLTGLYFNELIGYFEATFSQALFALICRANMPSSLRALLDRFVQEEAVHQQLWQRLNCASEPNWYADGKPRFVHISKIANRLIERVLCRPDQWTVVLWLMLALEERSMEISRRCLRAGCDEIEPHYQAAYALHRDDEALHIQIDRFLIETFFVNQSPAMRNINARLFRMLIGGALLKPARAARRSVELLLSEFPELRRRRHEIFAQLGRVHRDAGYQHMMYSRRVTPITFSLFDRFSEFWPMQRVLLEYRPKPAEVCAT